MVRSVARSKYRSYLYPIKEQIQKTQIMKSLGSICVKGQISKGFAEFKQDIEIALVESGFDSNEAELAIEDHQRNLRKTFAAMTHIIEHSPEQYKKAIDHAARVLKTIYK